MTHDASSARVRRRGWAGAVLLALLVFWHVPGFAQAPPAEAGRPAQEAITVDPAQLESLIRALEDADSRQAFIDRLKTLLAASHEADRQEAEQPPRNPLIAGMEERLGILAGQLVAAADALSNLPRLGGWIVEQARDTEQRGVWMRIIAAVATVLVAGFAARYLCALIIAQPVARLEARGRDGVVQRVAFAVIRFIVRALPVVAFAGATYAALLATGEGERARKVSLIVAQSYIIWAVLLLAVRTVLAPRSASLRLVMLGDETANYLFIWTRRLAFTAVFGAALIEALAVVGLPADGALGLRHLLGTLIAAMAVVFVLQNRREVRAWIRRDGGAIRARLADIWHLLAILYIAGAFAVWSLSIAGGFMFLLRASIASAAIVLVACLAVIGTQRALRRGFTVGDDLKARFPTLEDRANKYAPLINGVMRAAIAILALFALAEAWGLDSVGWLSSAWGRSVLSTVFNIAAVVVAALIAWEAVSQAVESYLNRRDEEGNVIARGARARTLLPLVRNVLLVVLCVLVTLIVLSELGVDIAPLLAGAGVVGLAIGFGSQKLVQDVITGAFILFEDSISVGDVVDVGGHAGVVEALSIRSLRLRDLAGSVHTVPFSAVSTVTNLTKEFSFYVFEVGVAYREDTDYVTQVLKEIGAELQEDPEFAPLIKEPLDVLGVDQFADSAVVIKARFKTLPIKQWTVGREFNRRMKRRFDELGIEIPFPHQTVYFGVDKDGNAPPARVVTQVEERPAGSPAGDVGEAAIAAPVPEPSPTPDPEAESDTR